MEWELAAQWWGYKPEQFSRLDGETQSQRIAAYRAFKQTEAVVAYQQMKEARRKHPRQSGKH